LRFFISYKRLCNIIVVVFVSKESPINDVLTVVMSKIIKNCVTSFRNFLLRFCKTFEKLKHLFCFYSDSISENQISSKLAKLKNPERLNLKLKSIRNYLPKIRVCHLTKLHKYLSPVMSSCCCIFKPYLTR